MTLQCRRLTMAESAAASNRAARKVWGVSCASYPDEVPLSKDALEPARQRPRSKLALQSEVAARDAEEHIAHCIGLGQIPSDVAASLSTDACQYSAETWDEAQDIVEAEALILLIRANNLAGSVE